MYAGGKSAWHDGDGKIYCIYIISHDAEGIV